MDVWDEDFCAFRVEYLTSKALAVKIQQCPHETLVLALSSRLSAKAPCQVACAVVVDVEELGTVNTASLEKGIAFHERILFRQRQWCDIILYTRDDEDIADSLVMAVYDALVKDKTEAMETAPPELLSKVQDKSVFILDGGLDSFRYEFPHLCDVTFDEQSFEAIDDDSPNKLDTLDDGSPQKSAASARDLRTRELKGPLMANGHGKNPKNKVCCERGRSIVSREISEMDSELVNERIQSTLSRDSDGCSESSLCSNQIDKWVSEFSSPNSMREQCDASLFQGTAKEKPGCQASKDLVTDFANSQDCRPVTMQERLRVAHQRVFRSLRSSKLFKAEPPSKVLSHLYLGSAQNAAMWRQLKAFGIQYILIVGSECQSYFPGCFDYMYFDVFDTPEETRIKDCFEPAYQFIEKARMAGSAVLVHCFCGIRITDS
jgi:hypothetical protein